jgi:hypothetical protein
MSRTIRTGPYPNQILSDLEAFTIANMPARMASGRRGHALMIVASSVSSATDAEYDAELLAGVA